MRREISRGNAVVLWYWLLATAVSLGLLGGYWLGTAPRRGVAEPLVAGLVGGLFVATGLLHWYTVAVKNRLRVAPTDSW